MATSNPSAKKTVNLTGAQETLLITLYEKWHDFNSPDPILADRWSAETLDSIEGKQEELYARLKNTPVRMSGVILRSRCIDRWTAEFLAKHDSVTIVHLACGLDSRAMRVQDSFGSQVRWIDVDMPDVVDLRRKLEMPVPEARSGFTYEMIASSVTEMEWLQRIPTDRPTAIVFEGLSMYLTTEDGEDLVKRVVSHFPTGELIFDSATPVFRNIANAMAKVIGGFNVTFGWAASSWKSIARLHPKLKVLDCLYMWNTPGRERFPLIYQAVWYVMSWIPKVRGFFIFQHFKF
jgi:O-methyltransferase involved in polyketide biosynthesis